MRALFGTVALLLALTTGCADPAPAGPTLSTTLVFRMNEVEDKGGLLPIEGRLELTIEPTGEARSACRRDIRTDVERKGTLTREQIGDLVARVEAWSSSSKDLPPAGENHGLIVYGAKKAGWKKDAALPAELQELVNYLLKIPPTLSVERRPKGK
jgi:hypothetical protein